MAQDHAMIGQVGETGGRQLTKIIVWHEIFPVKLTVKQSSKLCMILVGVFLCVYLSFVCSFPAYKERVHCICLQKQPICCFSALFMSVYLWLSHWHCLSDVKFFFADVDECVNGTLCGSHGFCENMDGSYRCLCYQGYQDAQDGQGCTGEFLHVISHSCKVLVSKKQLISKTHFFTRTFLVLFKLGHWAVKLSCALFAELCARWKLNCVAT